MNVLQEKVWEGRVPVEIRLASSECRVYDQSDPYLVGSSLLYYCLDEDHHFCMTLIRSTSFRIS
jgi:hypothetical protein